MANAVYYIRAFPVLTAILMSVLDVNILNISLPTLAENFGSTPSGTIWVVNAYQLAITMSLLIFAALSDIKGYRNIFTLGLILFTGASVLCALSPSLPVLVCARILQGVGSGAVMSVNSALIRSIYPPEILGRGISLNAMVVAAGISAGPSIAGLILTAASWHWLFIINVPLGITAIIMIWKLVPDTQERLSGKIHFSDCIGNAVTFGLFIWTLDCIGRRTGTAVMALQIFVLILVSFFYIRRQLKAEVPVLPVDLLKIKFFSLSLCTSLCSFTAQMLTLVSLPFYCQTVLHYTPAEAGLTVTPWPLAILAAAPFAGRLVEKIHPAVISGTGLVLMASGLLLLVFLPDNPERTEIMWRMALAGTGFGLFQTPNNVAIVSSAPKKRSGGIGGAQGTTRVLGQTMGTTAVAVVFALTGSPANAWICLLAGACCAAAGAVISFSRIGIKNYRSS